MATYSFTVRASDGSGVADRTFSIGVNNSRVDRFIATVTNGGGVYRSIDGINWTFDSSVGSGTGYIRPWVAYGNGKWVYTGSSTSAISPIMWSSPDGVVWTRYTANVPASVTTGITLCKYRNGKWMGFSQANTTNFVVEYLESTDAINWTKISNLYTDINTTGQVVDFEYANGRWEVLSVNLNGATYFKTLRTSNNGTTWSAITGMTNLNSGTGSTTPVYGGGVVWTGTNWVCNPSYGTANMFTSADGVTFTAQSITNAYPKGLVYAAGTLYSFSITGSQFIGSTNGGLTWAAATAGAGSNDNGQPQSAAAYGNVLVIPGSGAILYSTNYSTFTSVTAGSTSISYIGTRTD